MVTSGLNLETEGALNLCFFEILGKEAKFYTSVRGCRRCLTVITAGASLVVFFLQATVLKPSELSFTAETLGEGSADAASEVIPRSANSSEAEAVCANPETATAA